MGGSCKGGCLEDAKARLVLLHVFFIALYLFFFFQLGEVRDMLEDSLGVE